MPTQAELQSLWNSIPAAAPTQPIQQQAQQPIQQNVNQSDLQSLWDSLPGQQATQQAQQPIQQAQQEQQIPQAYSDVPYLETTPNPPSSPDQAQGSYAPIVQNYIQSIKNAAGGLPGESVGQKLTGLGEAALSTATGLTTGAVGGAREFINNIINEAVHGNLGTDEAANRIEQATMSGMERNTYQPRTQAGQQDVAALGRAMEPIQALGPIAGELGSINAPIRAPSSQTVQAVRQALANVDQRGIQGTRGAAGADIVDQSIIRQLRADELPVPIKLTKGQRSGEFAQRQFEKETAKQGELGAPLRERFNQQNLQIQQNLDEFLDQTGAKAFDVRDIGISVDNALKNQMAKDKIKINSLYAKADRAGETAQKIELPNLIQHINETRPEAQVAPVLNVIRQKAINLGAATVDENNNLVPAPISLKNAEFLRRSIGDATNNDPVNIRQATISKGLIDNDTKNAGGDIYKQARRERARFAQNYEDISLIKRLAGTKRGSSDRQVALENVLDEIVLKSPLDSLRQVRRVLHRSGEDGKQAWRDIQGGVIQNIRDQALKNIERDEKGNPVPSPAALHKAINSLDKSGKLDFIFPGKNAELLRTIDEVAQDLLVYPKDAVNWSNTASALLVYMDTIASFTLSGGSVPAPVITIISKIIKGLKNRSTKAKIREALR